MSFRQDIGPEFRTNDFMRMSARNDECWVHIKQNYGYSQFDGRPFLIYPDYHIDQAEYRRREAQPWPAEDEHPGTLTGPLARPQGADAPVIPTPKKKAKRKKKPKVDSAPTQHDLPLTEPTHNSLENRLDSMELDDE